MKSFKQFINENIKPDLIIVDIQPDYERYITNTSFHIKEFCDWLNKNHTKFNKIYFLYNGEDMGLDSWADISYWYSEHGLDQIKVVGESFEKGYGFFREPMDDGYERDDIIKVVRFMIENDITDIRDTTDYLSLDIADDLKEALSNEKVYMSLPDVVNLLKKTNNSIIVGGGENECLAEVEIILSALDKKYDKYKRFVY
jgi:hypothetical protein